MLSFISTTCQYNCTSSLSFRFQKRGSSTNSLNLDDRKLLVYFHASWFLLFNCVIVKLFFGAGTGGPFRLAMFLLFGTTLALTMFSFFSSQRICFTHLLMMNDKSASSSDLFRVQTRILWMSNVQVLFVTIIIL